MSDTGEDEGKRAEIVMLRWKCSIDDNEGPNSPDDSILVPYLDGLATCTQPNLGTFTARDSTPRHIDKVISSLD
jgi:hypothetical protein